AMWKVAALNSRATTTSSSVVAAHTHTASLSWPAKPTNAVTRPPAPRRARRTPPSSRNVIGARCESTITGTLNSRGSTDRRGRGCTSAVGSDGGGASMAIRVLLQSRTAAGERTRLTDRTDELLPGGDLGKSGPIVPATGDLKHSVCVAPGYSLVL